MIVYADVLIFLNLIINYFLLLAVSKILKKTPKTRWVVLSAFVGALSSLYIFLPQTSFLIETLFKIAVSMLMSIIAFGFKGVKAYIKSVLLLFGITVGFGGLMYAVWLTFSPNGMVINNSVVYFDISLIALIGFTVAGYIIFSVLFRIFSKNAPLAQRCDITLFVNNKNATLTAIIDTGNSIEDAFSMGEIIIVDKSVAIKLFECEDFQINLKTKSRYRMLPCMTVSGADVLEGLRCDSAEVKYKNQSITLNRPILAISKTPLPDGSNALINPKILN
ncbi:MAG: sigma-E processing peptidase SpoIIGA [Clostridia bacterium]|nr:sigma-E processing peptidase SpoIIGA [Clostridia bacterium]